MRKIIILGFACLLLSCNNSIAQTIPVNEEEINFSIPKTIYFGGERVWISSEALQGAQPAESKIIYAELVNRYNESVAIAKMQLENGESFNFLQLPVDLPSDNYLLRVFTRISPYQNIEKGLVQQFITVFNRTAPPAVVEKRKSVLLKESENIAISKEVHSAGSILDIQLPKADSIIELSVSILNPFLGEIKLLLSSEIYKNIESQQVIPELFGHIIEANIKESPDTTQLYYVSLHGQKSALFTDRPDAKGKMFFDAGGMKNWKYLIAQGDGNKNLFDFEIVSPAPTTHFVDTFKFPELEITPQDKAFLTELLKAGQVEGYFINQFDATLFPVVTGFVEDRTYLLDDYTRFETVETIIKEYVPEISLRTVAKKKEFRSINEIRSYAFKENPLMLIDAMPVFDSDRLAAFDPKGFEKLEVLNRVFYLNEEVFSGVISFTSYKNDFGGFPLPSNGIYLDYQGVQPLVTSSSNLFGKPLQDEKMEDWRSILFWSAVPENSDLSHQLSLQLPDTKAKYLISVKIRSSGGKEEVYERTFEIK